MLLANICVQLVRYRDAASQLWSEEKLFNTLAMSSNALVSKRDASGGLLPILENTIKDLRDLVTCRVCVRPMYEPYTILCGHSFCYSCLAQWFWNHKANKTCPDCRASVKQQPAPAYLVREMTQIFIGRAELMPAGETTNEHLIAKQEEASIVEGDRLNTDTRNGGLFRGCFNTHSNISAAAVIHDDEDGVTRCPHCSWELVNGFCNGCERNYDTEGELFYDDTDDSSLDQSGSDLGQSDGYHDLIEGTLTAHPDDISLDGDGYGVHTPNYNGEFTFGRTAAQGLIGRPINRNDSPATAQNRRRYTPSMLSDVATTQNDGDGYSEADEVEEEDYETSLDGFVVDDQNTEIPTFRDDETLSSSRSTRASSRGSSQGRNYYAHPNDYEDSCPQDYTEEWVDDSALSSDHRGHTEDEDCSGSLSNSSSASDESEAPAPPQPQSRKRRRVVVEVSSADDADSETDSERSRPRRRLSSSGSNTVGRQSPVLGSSRAIPDRAMSAIPLRVEVPVQSISSDSESDPPPLLPTNRRRSRPRHRGLHATRSPVPSFAHAPLDFRGANSSAINRSGGRGVQFGRRNSPRNFSGRGGNNYNQRRPFQHTQPRPSFASSLYVPA